MTTELNRNILQGQVLEKIKEIPDNSVDTIITSPPYWALRDYKVDGQWGLEPDFREYLKKLHDLMEELRRVLKKTGTCWVNIGDTYGGGTAHSDWSSVDEDFDCKRMNEDKFKTSLSKPKPKSRIGIPERFYIDCIDNGWIARNHIPWVKPNAMPSSIVDRFSNKWESIFFFALEQKYYFNLNAVRETPLGKYNTNVVQSSNTMGQTSLVPIEPGKESSTKKQDNTLKADGRPDPTKKGFNDRWNQRKHNSDKGLVQYAGMEERVQQGRERGVDHELGLTHVNGKNPGDVMFIASKAFPEAHFATFPPELPLKILKCACPEQVCKNCGQPRHPIREPTEEYAKLLGKGWHDHENDEEAGMQQSMIKTSVCASYKIVGYTDCGCNAGWRPGVVLDPFFGSGTVALAAEQLARHWIGIELKPDYIEIAKKRLAPFMTSKLTEFL